MDGPDPSELIDVVVAETGLEDFGAATFRDGLDVLCESIGAEAELNDLGGFAVRDTLLAALRTRLQVTDWVHRHPAVPDERIDAPIVVIGMFRAGTTLLGRLLDQDPGNRSLLRWESADPVPPPAPGELRAGPRVDAAQVAVEMLEQLNPAMRAIHHEDANGSSQSMNDTAPSGAIRMFSNVRSPWLTEAGMPDQSMASSAAVTRRSWERCFAAAALFSATRAMSAILL